MECKFCHAPIEDDAKFCPVCGKYDGKQILTVSEE